MGASAIVSGHLMFWETQDDAQPKWIGTPRDWASYTHIVYLYVDPQVIADRRAKDSSRARRQVAVEHLAKWQELERKGLRDICIEHGILFTTVSDKAASGGPSSLDLIVGLLTDFQHHDEDVNMVAVENAVNAVVPDYARLETMLVLDADKTLAPCDTGLMFWTHISPDRGFPTDPLSSIFKKQGYSYTSFRQATLLYEEVADVFDATFAVVAAQVIVYPEMITLLQRVAHETHVGAVVVTCGLRHVWEKVLERNGLSHIKVVGGGRLEDGYIVTGSVKGHIVDKLHEEKLRVLSFGDGPLDIEMLRKADEAYVIVGDKTSRSRSMEEELVIAIERDELSAVQVVLPKDSPPRLDLNRLPKVSLGASELGFIFRQRAPFTQATGRAAAKLLMTPTRDATNNGPVLRQAHGNVGYYLATEFLSEVLGLERIDIPHVQGTLTDGYRFRHEKATLIIPLMRGGEPLAFGVSKAMPSAGFAHARTFSDIKAGNWVGKRAVILVDSVINTGGSIVEFMHALRNKLPRLRVVVVVGVVQADAVKKGALADMLLRDGNLSIVALRESENKYKGQGTTDTGHRLFNTTYLA